MSFVPDAAALASPPEPPARLRRRMAEVYGVPEACVLPVRGAAHGLELVLRAALRRGLRTLHAADPFPGLDRLTEIYDIKALPLDGGGWGGGETLDAAAEGALWLDREPLSRPFRTIEGAGRLLLLASPSPRDGRVADPAAVRAAAAAGWVVIDESAQEFATTPALTALATETPGLVVLRDLGPGWGLPGLCCGAVVAEPAALAALEAVLEPHALPTPVTRAAEQALDPSRTLALQARIDRVRGERGRMVEALLAAGVRAEAGEGPWVFAQVDDDPAAALARFGVTADRVEGRLRLEVGDPAVNDRALAALGASVTDRPSRRAALVRDTKETRIAVDVDLDGPPGARVATGVGFFDHMLQQVATHGGFSLSLGCEGDLEIDPHHTLEDCMLALGAALKQALGDRRGLGRFGFVLPMDETQARVAIDLGGRPYAVFEGEFASERIGDYPTEMTAHLFRSLAESLGAAVHVAVTGVNDHHKTEACFKALGRALRQALRVEGADLPSTKGVIA